MSKDNIDYGPLAALIGTWKGDKGMDVAPEPEGAEESPYYETITYSPIGDVDNAESQRLVVLHYRQIVQRKSNDEVFHDETGYWMWDADSEIIMHSLTIPRGVCVLAGGSHSGKQEADGKWLFEVSAATDDPHWQIVQSPFMAQNARTNSFRHRVEVLGDTMRYHETTMLSIYRTTFEHTDQNELMRIRS